MRDRFYLCVCRCSYLFFGVKDGAGNRPRHQKHDEDVEYNLVGVMHYFATSTSLLMLVG